MSEIQLPPPLDKAALRALARTFIRGEAYVPVSEEDPKLSTVLKVVLRFVHDKVVAGHTEPEWTAFESQVIFIVNPHLDAGSFIPPADVRIILRSDYTKTMKLLEPLADVTDVKHPHESGYG